MLRNKKMKSYYEAMLLDGSPTCLGCSPYSALVWLVLYMINFVIIVLGFLKHSWIFIICGMYGIYELTWQFAKLYPNWFERKFILTSYLICIFSSFLLNYNPDYMRYKLYPITQ